MICKNFIPINHRDELYRKLKSHNRHDLMYEIHKNNYKEYNKFLKGIIKDCKTNYYRNEFEKYKDNIKKSWQTINQILNRDKCTSKFPSHVIVNNAKVRDRKEIANHFNDYFSKIGEKLSDRISSNDSNYKDYLKKTHINIVLFWLSAPK